MKEEFENKLMEIYHLGFSNELDGIPDVQFTNPLKLQAYNMGTINAIAGDDVMSLNYLTKDEILCSIYKVKDYFSFAKFLTENFEYLDNTNEGDIYTHKVSKKKYTEKEIFDEWFFK